MDRQALALVVAFVAAGVLGLVLLLGGDWLPGAVIVAAALVGLVVQLCRPGRGGDADSSLPHPGAK